MYMQLYIYKYEYHGKYNLSYINKQRSKYICMRMYICM